MSLAALLYCHCTLGIGKLTERKHFHVTVAPDLSNRLTKRCFILKDGEIVRCLADRVSTVLNFKRMVNQWDCYRIDYINPLQRQTYGINLTNIDFKHFENKQLDRVRYLQAKQFRDDTSMFWKTFDQLENAAQSGKNYGSDVYKYIETLGSNQIDTSTKFVSGMDYSYRDEFDNIILIFTDGYIETGKGHTPHFTLSGSEVDNFRKDFFAYQVSHKGADYVAFYKANIAKYGLKPVKNDLLKYAKIAVFQLWDRGETAEGAKHPELTDLKIIRLFWADWLERSGVKPENIFLKSAAEIVDRQSAEDALKKVFGI